MSKYIDTLNESFNKYGITEDFIDDELDIIDIDDIPDFEHDDEEDILSDDSELIYSDEDVDFEVDDDVPAPEKFADMFGFDYDDSEFDDDLKESAGNKPDKYYEVMDILKDHGYNVSTQEADNYIWSVLDYFDAVDDDYSVEQWFEDVIENHPEDLEILESLNEDRIDLANKIRSNDLEYDEETDSYFAKDGEDEVQFQDRETNTHEFSDKDGSLKKLNKQPKTSSNTWARLWKNGKLEASVDDSKYGSRNWMIKHLENTDSENESLEEKVEDKYVDIDWI